MSARDDVLGRIRAAHQAAPPPELGYDQIVRRYRTTSVLDHDELVDRLVDRLLDYKALVRRTTGDQLAATVATALAERGVRRLVVPDGLDAYLDEGWCPPASVTRLDDTAAARLTVTELDDADGVITTCAVAIAETGTLVLDASAGQGRRAVTLVPDYHLCVVRTGTVVADVPQALGRLDATRPLTMISGPSATSDIELNRVEGVHGPRTLEVIVVDERD